MKVLNLMLMTVISVSLLSQDIKTAEVKVFEGFVPKIPESEKIKETTFNTDDCYYCVFIVPRYQNS